MNEKRSGIFCSKKSLTSTDWCFVDRRNYRQFAHHHCSSTGLGINVATSYSFKNFLFGNIVLYLLWIGDLYGDTQQICTEWQLIIIFINLLRYSMFLSISFENCLFWYNQLSSTVDWRSVRKHTADLHRVITNNLASAYYKNFVYLCNWWRWSF